MKKSSHSRTPPRRGFSLVELLVVMAVIATMTTLTTPALVSILRGSETSRAVDQISGLVEHARATAMEMNTWVWIGLADTTAHNLGQEQLSLVEVVSRDGSADTDSKNLMQLRRPVRIDNVKSRLDADAHALVLGSQEGGFAFTWDLPTADGRKAIPFSSTVVAFSPRGDAVVNDNEVPGWIKISVGHVRNSSDVLSVLLAGPTGQVIVAR